MNTIVKFWHEARKTVVALVAGGIGWATWVVQSDQAAITSTEWLLLATNVAIALGVYVAPNRPADDSGAASLDFLVGLVLGILLGLVLVGAHVVHVG